MELVRALRGFTKQGGLVELRPKHAQTFIFSPNSLLLGVLNALKNGRLGAGWPGRVPGRLVSHFLSFVSQFFSFVSQFFSFVSHTGACGRVLAGLFPQLPFICLPLLFTCVPVLFTCLPGWVLVVGFPAGLSHFLSFVSILFICLPGHFFSLSPRLNACGRVPGQLVSHFLSFVSHFFSFVSQAGCLWSGSRPSCLPLPFICLPLLFICLPGWVLVVRFPAGLSPTSFHLSPKLGACGRVPAGLSSTSFHLSPTSFLLVVRFLAGLSPTCFHLSPGSFHLSPRLGACSRVPHWLVSHFLSFVYHFFSFVYHFFSIVSQFFSIFVSQAGCLWSGWRLACLPLPSILGACGRVPGRLVSHFLAFLPFPFICLPLLFICLPGWVLSGRLVSHFLAFVPRFFPKQFTVRVLNSFLRRVRPLCHCWCPPISTGHVTFLFIRLPGLSLLVSAHFRWPRSISIRVSPRSVTGGVRPFPLVV